MRWDWRGVKACRIQFAAGLRPRKAQEGRERGEGTVLTEARVHPGVEPRCALGFVVNEVNFSLRCDCLLPAFRQLSCLSSNSTTTAPDQPGVLLAFLAYDLVPTHLRA